MEYYEAYLYTIGRCSYKEDIWETLIIAYMMKND